MEEPQKTANMEAPLGQRLNTKFDSDPLTIICAVLIPPVAVALERGCGGELCINLLLSFFGFYILGLLHACYIILGYG